MKKIFLFIAIFYSTSFGQGWSNIWVTAINEPNVNETKLFTNKDGNHLLLMRDNGDIVYYNFSLAGTINTNKTITLATNASFPNIVGTNDKIYAFYKSGNFIKGKYSTNGGSSWSDLPDVTTTANLCDGVDAAYQDILGLHLVWATRDNGYNYETYYRRLDINTNQWVIGENKQVTDYGTEVGGQPKVTFSTNRIHVCYGTGSVKTRDRFSGTWQTPQPVINPPEESYTHSFIVSGDLLYFVFGNQPGGPVFNPDMDICTKNRSLSSSVWPSNSIVVENDVQHFAVTKTYDNNLHLIYMRSGLFYEFFNESIWSSDYQFTQAPAQTNAIGFSSRSNDLYAVLKTANQNNLSYCLYDAAPLAPQNPQLSSNPGNGMIRLSWVKSNEADISGYEVWRKVHESGGIWQLISTTLNNYIVDPTYYYAPGIGNFGLTYKVRAKDVGNNLSPYSSEVSTRGEEMGKQIVANSSQLNFSLDQNYPNPFNPSTKITYSIKEEGLVKIKVYDILGTEIVTLVNENKIAGIYEVEFNASQLPSGMYIYKIQSGSFSDVKKMLLTK